MQIKTIMDFWSYVYSILLRCLRFCFLSHVSFLLLLPLGMNTNLLVGCVVPCAQPSISLLFCENNNWKHVQTKYTNGPPCNNRPRSSSSCLWLSFVRSRTAYECLIYGRRIIYGHSNGFECLFEQGSHVIRSICASKMNNHIAYSIWMGCVTNNQQSRCQHESTYISIHICSNNGLTISTYIKYDILLTVGGDVRDYEAQLNQVHDRKARQSPSTAIGNKQTTPLMLNDDDVWKVGYANKFKLVQIQLDNCGGQPNERMKGAFCCLSSRHLGIYWLLLLYIRFNFCASNSLKKKDRERGNKKKYSRMHQLIAPFTNTYWGRPRRRLCDMVARLIDFWWFFALCVRAAAFKSNLIAALFHMLMRTHCA